MKYNFRQPKRHRGLLVIEDDDGPDTTYTQRYPAVMARRGKQRSRFPPFEDLTSYCPCINAGTVGGTGKVTISNLQEMQAAGCEIINHGKYHTNLGEAPLVEDVIEGDTTVVMGMRTIGEEGAGETEWIIRDDEKHEFFYFSEMVTGASETTLTLTEPLNNSYSSANTTVMLSNNGLETEINGGKTLLESWGLEIDNFVPPRHSTSPEGMAKVAEQHDSSRSIMTNNYNAAPNIAPIHDWYHIKSASSSSATKEDIDVFLEKIKNENGMGIWYGHAGGVSEEFVYIIEEAIRKNIRICNRREAYRIMNNL